MAMDAALEGLRRVLKEEKKEGNSAAAVKSCQVEYWLGNFLFFVV